MKIKWKLDSIHFVLFSLSQFLLVFFFFVPLLLSFCLFSCWANWVEDGSVGGGGVFNTWSVCNCYYYANFPFHCMRVFPAFLSVIFLLVIVFLSLFFPFTHNLNKFSKGCDDNEREDNWNANNMQFSERFILLRVGVNTVCIDSFKSDFQENFTNCSTYLLN